MGELELDKNYVVFLPYLVKVDIMVTQIKYHLVLRCPLGAQQEAEAICVLAKVQYHVKDIQEPEEPLGRRSLWDT